MKILVLIWEFPPRIVGGIARHGAELYPELVALGHGIHLVTVRDGNVPPAEIVEDIHVHRVSISEGIPDGELWMAEMNRQMVECGRKLLSSGDFDLIHAHDWMVTDAAIALQTEFHLPIVATIHATEFGRHGGIHNDRSSRIHITERELARVASQTIVCSEYMRHEVSQALACPLAKLNVIYNGIRPEKKQRPERFDFWNFRRRFAADREKIIYYVGRMTYEKGIFVLLNAAPKIIWELEGRVKIVIIGGGKTEDLKRQAWDLGIWDKCYFTGFMSEADLDLFQTIADCAVFPSLYEPFGIVALESFAARVPVVVSDAGGLAEVVRHGHSGTVTNRGDSNSLADGILHVLNNPGYAKWSIDNAYAELESRFHWADLAKQTLNVYQKARSIESAKPIDPASEYSHSRSAKRSGIKN
jgi:glycosyltransferase involved in cell wall biosynthesis